MPARTTESRRERDARFADGTSGLLGLGTEDVTPAITAELHRWEFTAHVFERSFRYALLYGEAPAV